MQKYYFLAMVATILLAVAMAEDGANRVPEPPPRTPDGRARLPNGLAYDWYRKAHPNGPDPHSPGHAPGSEPSAAPNKSNAEGPKSHQAEPKDEAAAVLPSGFVMPLQAQDISEEPSPPEGGSIWRRLPQGLAYNWYMKNNPNSTTPHPPGQPPAPATTSSPSTTIEAADAEENHTTMAS